MKTRIFSIIAIMLISIMVMGFTNKVNTNYSILIQSTDKKVSNLALTQSAKIISARLKEFSSEKFELSVIPEKNQIQVLFTGNWNLKVAEKLLTQNGKIGLYKTYNRITLAELLKDDQHLFSLLNSNGTNTSDAKIGCCKVSETVKVNDYLNSLGLNKTCKFAWSQPSDSSTICLYALQMEKDKGSLLSGSDMGNMKSGLDKDSKTYYIGFSFKKPAIALWADITKQNIGNPIAIVLDDTVLYAPILRSAIENGKCSITGDFTETELKLIATLGNNGELPVSFKVIE